MAGDNTTTHNPHTFADTVAFNGAATFNSTVTMTSPVLLSVATSITAFATGGQGSATALTEGYNEITTCATAGDSVKLPAAVAGTQVTVKNNGAAAADVFPTSGDSINALGVNTAVRIAVNSEIVFTAIDTTVWEASNQVICADTISEQTDAAGVTADGVLLKDGYVTTTDPNRYSSTAAITAFAGGGQGSATAITEEKNRIGTCATAGDSVKLPTAVAGMTIQLKNDGATAADVFPATGAAIDGAGANTAIRIAVGATIWFHATSTTQWESSNEALSSDTIRERTDAAGVTVDGLLIKDGGITSTIPNFYASGTTITAFATGGQASATALTKEFNEITTCATAGDSVKLPAAAGGGFVTVKNNGAAAADIFPASGDSINAMAVDLAIRCQPGEEIRFRAVDGTVWEASNEVLTVTDAVIGGTARRVGGYHSRSTGLGTGHTNSTDETALAVTTIPANTIKAGTIIKIYFKARVTADNAGTTLTCYLRLTATAAGTGGTALVTSSAVDTSSGHIFSGEYILNGHAAPGAAASIVGYGNYRDIAATPGGTFTGAQLPTGTTFATNAALYIAMTADWSAADANSVQAEIFAVEIVG